MATHREQSSQHTPKITPKDIVEVASPEVKESRAEEAALDEALWETFPASDPIAVTIPLAENRRDS